MLPALNKTSAMVSCHGIALNITTTNAAVIKKRDTVNLLGRFINGGEIAGCRLHVASFKASNADIRW